MNKKLIYSLVGLALVFFITSLFIFLKSGSDSKKKEGVPLKDKSGKEIAAPSIIKVKTFFFIETSRFMRPVQQEIELTGIKQECYQEFIDLLIKGKENYISPVPGGTRLRSVYFIEKQKMLVLDFNEELILNFPAGTTSELEFIYFIVDNICFNFKEVSKVKFLISGNEYRTLSGHIDMENAFYPDYRYLRDD